VLILLKNRMSIVGKVDVLLGLQWGDEGKGKIVDVLSPFYQLIARFQGGPNAGHTLEFDNKKYVLHTIPSGIFHPGCMNVIGNGVVIDPYSFSMEVQSLGLSMERLKQSLLVAYRAQLILPTHRLLDMVYEHSMGNNKIGSTLKGIGPAYTDKVARAGLRLADARRKDFFEKYQVLKENHLRLIHGMGCHKDSFKLDGVDFDTYEKYWFDGLSLIGELTHIESEIYINQALAQGVKILAEGAQGTLLDIDFGTYPFVTSSSTIAAGACTGTGIAPARIGDVIGIFKAYCTRVGSGPFPTELSDADGERMRRAGNEFGSTTGRPRRCGWLDLPALKYAVMINGVNRLVMTKADVLNDFETIKVCTAYQYNDEIIGHPPSAACQEESLKPVYTALKGWNADMHQCKTISDLPGNLQEYIRFIEDFVGVSIQMVSTGPNRSQILY